MSVQFKQACVRGRPKKYPCPDCRFCQQCSNTRCNSCRSGRLRRLRLSFAEQIALYEGLNKGGPHRPDQPLTFD